MKTAFTYLKGAPMNLVPANGWGNKVTVILLFLFCLSYMVKAQTKVWDKTFGGNNYDGLSSVITTPDGGYLLGGTSNSGVSGDKTEPLKGGRDCESEDIFNCASDFWLVKTDKNGNKIWDKSYGNSGVEKLTTMIATPDGGYLLGGYYLSYVENYYTDFWLVKIDGSGNVVWDKYMGGYDIDDLTTIVASPEGGYLLGVTSRSGIGDDKTDPNKSGQCDSFIDDCPTDFWVIKIDESGNTEWDKTIGGTDYEYLAEIVAAPDGGYLLAGSSDSGISGDKTEARRVGGDCNPYTRCSLDYWVVKIDGNGNIVWDKTFGGSQEDKLSGVVATLDGGYLLGGTSRSPISGDKSKEEGGYWVVKINSSGSMVWDKSYSISDSEFMTDMIRTPDDNFLLGGYYNNDNCNNPDESCAIDFWVLKINGVGDKIWDVTYGGGNNDYLRSLTATLDGGYILGGTSDSESGGDKTENSKGLSDYWILKVKEDSSCTPPNLSITVVPTSDVFTGGNASTIYLGYGPQSVVLQASGAEVYSWSPSSGLSETTVANPFFTPTAAGTYTFTVQGQNGSCIATASVTIEVVDVRSRNGKVLVCHKGKVISIPASAVAAHLSAHQGDKLGSCSSVPKVEANADINLIPTFKTYPNPFRESTSVELTLPEAGNYRLELYNDQGKLFYIVAEGQASTRQNVKHELRAGNLEDGTYYLRLITSDKVYIKRLMLIR